MPGESPDRELMPPPGKRHRTASYRLEDFSAAEWDAPAADRRAGPGRAAAVIRGVLVAALLAAMARRGVELALGDPSQPAERTEQVAASRDEAIAAGTARCEELRPPPEVLACMVAAKTHAEYAACGDKFAP